jgi:2-oxoglutarate dehydrogenase E2 component (dihydrolipoamide succinyltransferase)
MATKVIMPQLGESVVEGTISKWLVKEGDTVKKYDPLLEVSSDKVDTEVPSPVEGTVLKIYVPEGTTVQAGTLIAVIGEPGEAIPEAEAPAQAAATAQPEPQAEATETAPAAPPAETRDLGFISPVVAKLAAEYNVDLTQVKGTGVRGRIRKKDVLEYIKQREAQKAEEALPEWEKPGTGDLFKPATAEEYAPIPVPPRPGKPAPPPPPAPGAPPPPPPHAPAPPPVQPGDEIAPLSRMRRLIADHMVQSKRTSPHVTTVFLADMTRVVQHRYAHKDRFARDGVQLTFTPYFIMALAQALKKHPYANSSWSEEGIVLHRAIHIGMATAIEDGLIVPVIKNADSYNLLGLARMVNDLAARARAGKLSPDEIQGATFTLTNHGTSGSLFASPIINQPNAGILGVGAIHKEPVVISQGHPLLPDPADYIAIRPVAYLSFTFDHRILDGATADAFVAEVKRILENWSD